MSQITPSRFAFLRAMLSYAGVPLMLFATGVGLLFCLGVMQQSGWISAGDGATAATTPQADVDYICPMMCVPPVKSPGRCPVCAMELVPAANKTPGDSRSIVVDAATRRVANIRTVTAATRSVSRTIRSVGAVQYDEGSLRTITAYVAGRIEELYVDYTGAVVQEGDRLATLYSPQLHTAAVEYLQAMQNSDRTSGLAAVATANLRLRGNARRKLEELGLTEAQIANLEQNRQPASRVDISAPLSGTVIRRLAVQGETVTEGQPLFRLADLSSVWLMLELFPEDAPQVRYGQKVTASVRSLPGETFYGRVAFVSPEVDATTRTVQVRVVIENTDGRLRIGDYAAAEIRVPVGQSAGEAVYDPELAGKWISPRHPHIMADQPGLCPVCGEPLVAAAELGFTTDEPAQHTSVVVPRDAVLQAAGHSVLYVEEQPGFFAMRQVIAGAVVDDQIAIKRGLSAGEVVASGGSFLLDSQMQLAGNPSLIDPLRMEPPEPTLKLDETMLAAIDKLPTNERQLAIKQKICPVTELPLGSMGVPPKATIEGRPVYLCCEGCRRSLMKDPTGYLKRLDRTAPAEEDRVPLPPDQLPADEPADAPASAPLLVEPSGERSQTEHTP